MTAFLSPDLVSSDEEDWLSEVTAFAHDQLLDDIARQEMDNAHSEYLQNRKSSLQPASGSSQPVVIKVDEKGPGVDLCKSDEHKKISSSFNSAHPTNCSCYETSQDTA